MLERIEKRPVRLIGTSIYNLTDGREARQLSFDDFLSGKAEQESEFSRKLEELGERYKLDFAGHLDQLYRGETLHRTAEYMRKRKPL